MDGCSTMVTLSIIDLSLSDLLKGNSSNLFVPVLIFSQHKRDNDTLHNGQVLFTKPVQNMHIYKINYISQNSKSVCIKIKVIKNVYHKFSY